MAKRKPKDDAPPGEPDSVTGPPPELALYTQLGFRLIFYTTKTKGPTGPAATGWTKRSDSSENYTPGDNIGVFTGHELSEDKFLADIDFDWSDGIVMAKRLLPKTGFGLGRSSRFISHALYTTPRPLVSKDFTDLTGKCLVELRGTKTNGEVGLQTMVAPSIHPSGEQVILRESSEIGHSDDLERRVTLYAVACLLLQQLGQRGLLHDTRLATAGFLLGEGLTPDETIAVCEAVAEASGNNVADVKTAVESTSQRIKNGERSMGKTALAQAIGENGKAVLSKIRDWLGGGDFLEDTKGSVIANNQENIRRAFQKLEVVLRFDEFSNRPMIKFQTYDDVLQDHTLEAVWLTIEQEFHFRPTYDYFAVVAQHTARANTFHPVRDYLGSLKWDGVPRVDRWLITYGKAADTDYVQAVSSLIFIAAVKRVFEPGCKFDELLVLESNQGLLKSSALRILCPNEDWFSDDLPLGVEAKELIERTQGKWIIEAAELSGIRATQTEHLKSLLSRQVDGPVRLAYGRIPVERPRQFIVVGTTNSHHYLKDTTGNRRFWPIRVEKFDIQKLREDRDQLWAEATHRCLKGESIRLRTELHKVAGVQQERRRSEDPWEEKLRGAFDFTQDLRVEPEVIWETLCIPIERRDEKSQSRILAIMQRLGFRRGTVKGREKNVWGHMYDTPEGVFWPKEGKE
jgi:hypothetical protein